MIWMGVDGPKDFVATLKRLPIHLERFTNAIKRLFVAILSPNQLVFDHQSADSCRNLPYLASGRIRRSPAILSQRHAF